ncbi:MAG: hypothetical protein ABTD50_18435 [Polyangiaceae bacterium]|jgi:hypothetical protein
MMSGRSREAQVRFSERRRREDEALRLKVEVPGLLSLKLEVEERRGSSTLSETKHVRVVVVDRAPALFFLPCGDRDCRDGGHDVTYDVMRGLREGNGSFEVEDTCAGSIRGVNCGRIVKVAIKATYA